ncbi:MAG: hypothetical protein HYX78_11725 [Armatimonadetes bacterium]|nr:hypothetical protein [Armatimonadota bacterium]
MFSHLPRKCKCEWVYIRPFVEQFNQESGSDYQLKECLDARHRNVKAPEVLLEDSGGQRLLIERKTISWPPERCEILRPEHELPDRILNALGGELSGGLYALRIEISSLNGAYGNKHVARWMEVSDTIVRAVSHCKERILAGNTVGSRTPVPWSCGPASRDDMGIPDTAPETGLIVIVAGGWDLFDGSFDNIEHVQQRLSEATVEIQSMLTDRINDTVDKFEAWRSVGNALRILLIEPYGDIDIALGEGVFEEIIQSTCQGRGIDQVWIVEEDWISEEDYEVAYRQCFIASGEAG